MPPSPFSDPVLGLLRFEEEAGWWTGEWVGRQGRKVELYLQPAQGAAPTSPPHAADLEGYRAAFGLLREREDELRRLVAESVTDLARDWQMEEPQPDGEDELTEDQVFDLLDLLGAGLGSDGSLSLEYLDGDMFSGHRVHAEVDADGALLGGAQI